MILYPEFFPALDEVIRTSISAKKKENVKAIDAEHENSIDDSNRLFSVCTMLPSCDSGR